MRGFSERYARQRHGAPTLERLEAAVGAVAHLVRPFTDRLDEEDFVGRARSTSYVHHGEGDRVALERDLRAAFARYADADGRAPFEYEAVAFAWRADRG